MSKSMLPKFFIGLLVIIVVGIASLFMVTKEDTVKLLYITNGDAFDSSAWDNFQQSLQANLRLDKQSLSELSLRKLKTYDTLYLDPGLHNTDLLKDKSSLLTRYVENGGHLFLENAFATDFSADFLGAQQVVTVPPVGDQPAWSYPAVDPHLEGLQKTFRLFTDSYFKQETVASLPGFDWGYGLIPTTAKAVVQLNQLAVTSVNQVGKGSVLLSSSFMPNRYFPTGYDLASGMDPKQGFAKLAAKYDADAKPVSGSAYFNRRQLPLEPYFHFAFAAANTQFRSEYIAYVSKEKLGYSIKKVLGPYGRPAMAFQNHFEALPAFEQNEGIQWAELLKKYNEIPSFTLVRSAFTWGQWRESLTVQLNTGTNEQPQFVGELPGSGYSSGLHLRSQGQPLRLATFPQYRDLSSAIELPYRAYPAFADLDGDSRPDLLVGSADGFVYAYTNLGVQEAAYASEPPPTGIPLPDSFGEARKLELESGKPLQLGPYATIHVADMNDDGVPDLIASDESGQVLLLPGRGSGRFGEPIALRAGSKLLQVQGPAAIAVADVNGDGLRDLVVGDADGRVLLFEGRGGLELAPSRQLFQLPAGARYAAPAVRDMNGDGRLDLVVGSSEGDLKVYLQEANGTWTARGPLEGSTLNQMGNKALVNGHHSVPLWLDINHDGKDDLIVGGVEFGSPIAIDDPAFPYKEQLNTFLQYARDNALDLNPHLFFHNFKSNEQEQEEIALHKKAFERLGIPWITPGTNQHTWRTNFPDRLQTLNNERDQQIWYNFGFYPAHTPALSRPEGIWSLPFLLQKADGKQAASSMLIHTPTPVLRLGQYSTKHIFEAMAELDMPIDYFEHIEYHFAPDPSRVAELTQFADYFDKLRTQHDYNFMTETQMAKSFMNTLTSEVKVQRTWAVYLRDKLKDRLASRNPHWNVTLKASTNQVPAQAGEYTNTLGVVIEKGKKYLPYNLRTDSSVYTQEDQRIYLGVSGSASLSLQSSPDEMHLIRSNVPFKLTKSTSGSQLELQAAGMQQIKLYSPELLQFDGPELKIEHNELDKTYTITHYGQPITIQMTQAGISN